LETNQRISQGNMKNLIIVLISLVLISGNATAITAGASATTTPATTVPAAITPQTEQINYLEYVRVLLQQILDVNLRYEDKFHELLSEDTLKNQTPNTTLVLCSDSRVDPGAINDMPAGKVFVIRNIGNQITTSDGSIEYGVKNLKTPLLLIVGHSECGAIKAAMGGFGQESAGLQKELSTIKVDKQQSLNNNILSNINDQVAIAMKEFELKIKSGELAVIGMFYDMHNNFNFGNGRLVIVNINNETNPKALLDNPYVKGLKNLTILGMSS